MEGSLRRSVFVAKTLLTQWRGSLYREWGITPQRAVMERLISIRRPVFRRTVLIQRVVVERMVQKVVSYIALLP